MDAVAEEQEDAEFERWYGAWDPLDPAGAADLLNGLDRPWWIVGGWAIDAFTGVPREHEDLDVSLLSSDVPALREHLRGRWCLWCNDGGTLRPLSDRWPEPFGPDNQLWLRHDALSPWVLDLPLTPERDGRWSSKRWESHVLDLAEATWVAGDGLRYLRPEIVLHYKARLDRPKDRRDLEVAWPLLDDVSRAWLRAAVGATEPGDHPWQQLLTLSGVGGPERWVDGGVMSDQSITVSRTIQAPTQDVFTFLTNPERHPELDGSGFVISDEKTDRITATGQVFRMNMSGDHMGGDYQTDNTVTGYDPNHLVAWQTAPADTPPPGWEWTWELKSLGSDSCDVSLTYDWSKVTDKDLLSKITFPLVQRSALEGSLDNLASAVSG